ncbi:TPA: heteromeric transposase endonuclease subunit TnsA, partial [Escherichia coli]|nr:heteromeric transposase endonuclease subunit TnsA [Escherichia coli]
RWATAPFRSGMTVYDSSIVQRVLTAVEPGKYLLSDLCKDLTLMCDREREDGLNLLRYLIADKFINVNLDYSIEACGGVEIQSVSSDKRLVSNGY